MPFKDGKLETNKKLWIKRKNPNKLFSGVTIGVVTIIISLLKLVIQ